VFANEANELNLPPPPTSSTQPLPHPLPRIPSRENSRITAPCLSTSEFRRHLIPPHTALSNPFESNNSKRFVLITNLTHFFDVFISISTCFEQPSAHHQGNQLYQYIIWYVSLCVGSRKVCRSLDLRTWRLPTQSDTYQMMYWYNWFPWWWALGCSKHVENEINTSKKCVKLIINTKCTEKHGQQNIFKKNSKRLSVCFLMEQDTHLMTVVWIPVGSQNF